MPFPTDRVGTRLQAYEVELTTRKILAYAGGLGASEAAYLDDVQEQGLRALPFLCVSPEWPVLLSMRHLLDDALPPEEARRGVHAIQDSTFHRPMRPGDRLVTEGQLVSATRIRSGVLTVCKLITRAEGDPAPVTTTWTSSIYRDVDLAGDEMTLESPPASPSLEPPGPDAVIDRLHIPREMPHVYSECADIWNPIHSERREALAAGLPDIILHGTATWALAGLTILRRYASNDVSTLKRMTGRFSGMVIPGGDILIHHQKEANGMVRFEVRTSAGASAISQGAAWLE